MKRFLRHTSATAGLTVAALLALLLLAAVLPGCGGVDSGGTGQTVENTPTTAQGRIAGFGSVIVNGVRFDDTQATVVDDDGAVHSRTELQLGMVVELQGEVDAASQQGVATRIQFGAEIAGPVDSVDVAGSRLVVLGQPVRVDVDTIFGGYPAGLPGVQAGHLVELHALYDSVSGTYAATRIELKASLGQYTLRGRVSGLAGPPHARTFNIGAAPINASSVPPLVPPLAEGELVRVRLDTTPVGGRWMATRVQRSQALAVPDDNDAKLEGFVSGYAGAAAFFVAGVPVDASGPDVRVNGGSLDDLGNGVRVEVEGRVHAGVLVAERVHFKRGGEQEFELHGAVESLDTAARTLVLRGITVAWDGTTRFMGGNAGRLAVGARIEVRGTPVSGVRLQADSIRFER